MDRVSKFLLKLSRSERERVMPVVADIVRGSIIQLDCKKLKGRNNEYRVRVGSIRIQFIKTTSGNLITKMSFRNDNTY